MKNVIVYFYYNSFFFFYKVFSILYYINQNILLEILNMLNQLFVIRHLTFFKRRMAHAAKKMPPSDGSAYRQGGQLPIPTLLVLAC